MTNKIPLVGLFDQYQTIKPEIDAAIQYIITGSAFVGGEAVRRFEKDFAAYCEAKACVGVGNGTDALPHWITAASRSEVGVSQLNSNILGGETPS